LNNSGYRNSNGGELHRGKMSEVKGKDSKNRVICQSMSGSSNDKRKALEKSETVYKKEEKGRQNKGKEEGYRGNNVC